jgi:hypothetical protein
MNLSEIVGQVSKESAQDTPPVDIITFCESPWGLNMNKTTGNTCLRPVQKLILKCFYNIPLDDKEKSIIVRDFLNEQELYKMTEKEYLDYLWSEGRTNLRGQNFSIHRNELVLVCGRRSGKCVAKGTLVLTPLGPVAIEELKVGDTVYGYNKDGSVSETKVKNTFVQGVKEVVELLNHGRVLAASTEDHRWLCTDERNTKKFEQTPAEFGVRHGKNRGHIVRRFVKIPCGSVNEPHAYAIGALLGDGCSKQPGNTITISSNSNQVPAKVASILDAEFKRSHPTNYSWVIFKQELLHSKSKNLVCKHYDDWCRNKYAHEKTVDLEVIKSWDRESCLNFIAGLLDTDGSVYANDGCLNITISMQAKPVIEAFKYLFLRLFQYDLTVHTDAREKYKNGPCYVLKVKNNFFVRMALKELDPYLVTPSKKWKPEYENFIDNNSNPDFVGVQLGGRYKAETYDIEVDNETNLYVLANQGLVTHNSKLGAIVSAYEAYALIKKPHPQKHYGITDDAEIYISTVATSTDQAQLLFNDIAAYIDHSAYFSRYKNPPTLQYMTLKTLRDLESASSKSASIIIQAAPCSARGLRGMSNMVVIMDEQAHFVDSSANTSDTVIYDAVTPSTLSFGKDAKILNLSSPLNKQGKLWELFNQSFGSEKLLMFQVPTWEMYPDIDSSELRERYRRNPDVYWCEIGAKFSDTVKSWMPRDPFMKCIIPDLKPKMRGKTRTSYFMGVDIGLKKDMTAFSVVHIEHVREPVLNMDGRQIDELIVPKYELDYQEIMHAGKGEYAHMEFLDFDMISERIEAVCKEFSIQKGLFDQYNGVPLKQALDKKGLNQFEMMYFDRRINSELYNNFILQVIDGKLRIYDEGGTSDKPGEFISEVLDLQSENISKYITLVAAPEVDGKHDDRSDSFVRALWCATQWAIQKGALEVTSPLAYEMNNSQTFKKQNLVNGYSDPKRTLRRKSSPYSVFFNKRYK